MARSATPIRSPTRTQRKGDLPQTRTFLAKLKMRTHHVAGVVVIMILIAHVEVTNLRQRPAWRVRETGKAQSSCEPDTFPHDVPSSSANYAAKNYCLAVQRLRGPRQGAASRLGLGRAGEAAVTLSRTHRVSRDLLKNRSS